MIKREMYLEKIRNLYDSELIKVITGIRRCGKSVLLMQIMEELKEKGLWFVCADMDGEVMYRQNLTGPIGLVIGNEGNGVSRLVKEKCDFTTAIPMKGDIDSLNASVAAGLLLRS